MNPGDLVSHFRIVQKIGEGGMGEVFIAQDETLKRRVALKTIRTTKKQRTDAHTRFAREARVLSQLDHPHICRIFEYITSDDGDMIVLELIEGRPLTQLGGAVKYAEKLVIAEQIASALVAAHAEGIVHRDLKPANIMLTRSSGVKVLDFGLACVANTEDDVTTAHTPSPESSYTLDWSTSDESISGFHTEAGRVFGTVQYMAPEQADGENVGPAADMFSFGLVLQEIFTGEPARRLVKQDGLTRAAEGFSLPVKGVPRDLADLITRLKERAPTRRPTALDALKDLQRIRSKPQRRLRAVLIGGVAFVAVVGITKYTLDLKRYARDLEIQRAKTEDKRKEVEDTNSYILGDLFTKLEPVGRTDVLAGASQRVLDYYAAIPADALLPDQVVNYAQAWIHVGRVRGLDKNTSESLDAYNAALKLLDSPAAVRVSDPDKTRLRRYALFWSGDVYKDRLEPERAEQAYRAVFELSREESSDWGDPKLCARAWSGRVQTRLANLMFARNEFDQAREQYMSARDCFSRISKPNPEEQYLSAEVDWALFRLDFQLQDLDAAGAWLRKYLDTTEALAASEPSNVKWRKAVAFGHTNLGGLLQSRMQPEEARAEFARSVELWRGLTIFDGGNWEWKNSLADALSWLAGSELRVGRLTDAIDVLEQEYDLRVALTSHDPNNMAWIRTRTTCENNMADAFETLGRLTEAKDWFTNAVAHSRQLAELDPRNKELQLELVVKLRRLGMNLTDLGEYEPARIRLEEALSILDKERANAVQDASVLLPMAQCRNNLAELYLEQSELDLAAAELKLAKDVLSHSTLVDAQDRATKDVRGYVFVTSSSLLYSQGRETEAAVEAQSALDNLVSVLWKSFTGRRARACVAATRIAKGESGTAALLAEFVAKGYPLIAFEHSPGGN